MRMALPGMTRLLLAALLFGATLAGAAPPDQLPLAIGATTPNFNYLVRPGGMTPHLIQESRVSSSHTRSIETAPSRTAIRRAIARAMSAAASPRSTTSSRRRVLLRRGGGRGEVGCGAVVGTTACEGQACALHDKVYFDLDLNPAANCVPTFCGEVDGYSVVFLANTACCSVAVACKYCDWKC
jgi:hypothetical protein